MRRPNRGARCNEVVGGQGFRNKVDCYCAEAGKLELCLGEGVGNYDCYPVRAQGSL
jgi:hypothetical protein